MYALVIDDSASIRRLESTVLELAGMQVQTCSSATEARGLIEQGATPDLILVDWNMPGMGVLDFVRFVRGRFTADQTYIMLVTAETSLSHVDDALQAGANEYLMKPFEIPSLMLKLVMGGVLSATDVPARFMDPSLENEDACFSN
jgi:two-component system, chemotaxis family, chemotaxis protein CheY